MKKQNLVAILAVGMTLATSWAVRGQFGHEQGAAWAGGIGALALVLISKRNDWLQKIFPVALASALGWGMTGMISYGAVVGYGRADNYPNAFYGLLMLFVIGGLFGLIGGGLTGLSLESSQNKKVKWENLVVQMVAGGIIFYSFLVEQIGVLMTPPRAENWAVSLGAGLAMLWFMVRNEYRSSLRVALITSLGAGFGFAFGNFLQTVGTTLQINFNFWNVMEYSIGFFGGTSLAYAVFTSRWPDTSAESKDWKNRFALLFLAVFIPFIVFRESLGISSLTGQMTALHNAEQVAELTRWVAAIVIALFILSTWVIIRIKGYGEKFPKLFFAGFFGLYIILSYLKTGVLGGQFLLTHQLYVVNYAIIFILIGIAGTPFPESGLIRKTDFAKYKIWFLGILIFIALLALISISIHDGLPGANYRFTV